MDYKTLLLDFLLAEAAKCDDIGVSINYKESRKYKHMNVLGKFYGFFLKI